jgi:OmpA family protein
VSFVADACARVARMATLIFVTALGVAVLTFGGVDDAPATSTHPWFCFFKVKSTHLSDTVALLAGCKKVASAAVSYARSGARPLRLEVQGHATDGAGEAENNRISLLRALEVEREVKGLGVPDNEITVVGLGASRPYDKANRMHPMNRRVEIVPARSMD